MIRDVEKPMDWAASTYSELRSRKNSPRTNLVIPVHDTMPIANMIMKIDFWSNNATIVRIRNRPGMQMMISTSRMMRRSTSPPKKPANDPRMVPIVM